jgi:hypothetical protein
VVELGNDRLGCDPPQQISQRPIVGEELHVHVQGHSFDGGPQLSLRREILEHLMGGSGKQIMATTLG